MLGTEVFAFCFCLGFSNVSAGGVLDSVTSVVVSKHSNNCVANRTVVYEQATLSSQLLGKEMQNGIREDPSSFEALLTSFDICGRACNILVLYLNNLSDSWKQ